jgi:hypothetical protein
MGHFGAKSKLGLCCTPKSLFLSKKIKELFSVLMDVLFEKKKDYIWTDEI